MKTLALSVNNVGPLFDKVNGFFSDRLGLSREAHITNNVSFARAVSSQGMQDHFGAKSANWLAG